MAPPLSTGAHDQRPGPYIYIVCIYLDKDIGTSLEAALDVRMSRFVALKRWYNQITNIICCTSIQADVYIYF